MWEEERRRSQGSLPQFSNASIVSSKTKLTRRTAYTSASTMSNSVALSLVEIVIATGNKQSFHIYNLLNGSH